jgi:hypothetical protein
MVHPLGRLVEHDERSRMYAVDFEPVPWRTVTHRRYGGPFDQGHLGSCTGNAVAGALNTAPLHKTGTKLLTEAEAVAIYERATVIDSFPGSYPPDDTGSSGLAACKAARQKGYVLSYWHAFDISAAIQALMRGPLITGVSWYEGFDYPSETGRVEISGDVRGGHEFEVLGFHLPSKTVACMNSWGTEYGVNGRFRFSVDTWERLLGEEGDATVLRA